MELTVSVHMECVVVEEIKEVELTSRRAQFIYDKLRIFVHLQCVTGLLLAAAWDQAPCWEAKKKKMGKQSEPSGSLGRGKGGRRQVASNTAAKRNAHEHKI